MTIAINNSVNKSLDNCKQTFEAEAHSNASKSFPLAMACVGEGLLIVKLKGSEGIIRRLIGMGLVPGVSIQIMSTAHGSVVVALGDCRIGLGVAMAQKVMCTYFVGNKVK